MMKNLKRLPLYKELLSLATQELQLIKTEDFEDVQSFNGLEKVLEKKREIMDQIDGISEKNSKPSAEEQSIIKQILQLDMESQAVLGTKKDAIKINIHKIQQGKRTTKAYQPQIIQAEGYFVDRKK